MDVEQLWEKAQQKTEVIRGRAKGLLTFARTAVPYIFLAESAIHDKHTLVRKGQIDIEKPLIVLPDNMPQFEGFEFEEEMDVDMDTVQMFFLMRGIRMPSLRYSNNVDELEVLNEPLGKTVKKHKEALEKQENVSTALVLGPEDCWQFSLLLYMGSLVGRSARTDIMNLMDRLGQEEE